MSALRHVRGHPLAGRAPQAYSCSTPRSLRKHNAVSGDDCGTAVDNLCITPAKEATELPPSFFDSSRFTLSLSQIIEFCTSDPSSFDHFDRLDRGRVERKNPLNPVTH